MDVAPVGYLVVWVAEWRPNTRLVAMRWEMVHAIVGDCGLKRRMHHQRGIEMVGEAVSLNR